MCDPVVIIIIIINPPPLFLWIDNLQNICGFILKGLPSTHKYLHFYLHLCLGSSDWMAKNIIYFKHSARCDFDRLKILSSILSKPFRMKQMLLYVIVQGDDDMSSRVPLTKSKRGLHIHVKISGEKKCSYWGNTHITTGGCCNKAFQRNLAI